MNFISPVLILCAFVFLSHLTTAHAQSFGKAELIKAVPILEATPFSKEAKDIRALAVRYVIETDEVSVVVCGGDLMAAILDKKNKNSTELIGQYTIGMAAFKLQNPNNNDENAAQLAGLESALKAYEAMIVEKPKTKHSGMDELQSKRNSGTLKALVDKADCGKK